jgi:pimeloyl-ACP methyl ester carboxylesterase
VPLTRYSFPIHTYLPKAATPVMLIHGTDDEIIPFKQAKRLAEENEGVQLVTVENGKHNNLASFPVFKRIVDSLLQTH